MRGAPGLQTTAGMESRIIPAYAGSTADMIQAGQPPQDHPGVCGEHASMGLTLMIRWGSSPRMRGAPARRSVPVPGDGIIPAYAGSTDQEVLTAFVEEDHPRVCGEHGMQDLGNTWNAGSSPRMRGAPLVMD